jgi:hypothetical protein
MPEPDPAAASGTYASDVERLTGDILQQWRQRLRRRADDSPRTGDRGEYERLLVGALLRASSSADDAILPGLAAAAARYATRERRLDPTGLCDELSCLGEIVQSELKSRQPSVDLATDPVLGLDRALSIVVKAAVTANCTNTALSDEST